MDTLNNYSNTPTKAKAATFGQSAQSQKSGCGCGGKCGDCPDEDKIMKTAQDLINKRENLTKNNSNMRPNLSQPPLAPGMNGNNSPGAFASWRNNAPPAPIILTATVGAGINKLYMGDATGLFADYGGAGAGSQEFGLVPPATLASFKRLLQTKWFYISNYNVSSSDATQISKNLQKVITDMDGQNKPFTISSAINVSNQQFNPDLLNICGGFLMTNQDALTFPVSVVNSSVAVTLNVGASGAYGDDLADFLKTNPNFKLGVPSNLTC